MRVIADTTRLVEDGLISPEAAAVMKARSRATMLALVVNGLLVAGILAVIGGLIVWLADAASVAAVGTVLAAAGFGLLARAPAQLEMVANACALIGAGLLIGGTAVELFERYETIAGWVSMALGAIGTLIAWRAYRGQSRSAKFVVASIGMMTLALHLVGLVDLLDRLVLPVPLPTLASAYIAAALIAAGAVFNLRLITALAIVPIVQMLNTQSWASGVILAPLYTESTISIALMVTLMVTCFWVRRRNRGTPVSGHAAILASMGFLAANIAALLGSFRTDHVGDALWGAPRRSFDDYEQWLAARDAFRQSAVSVPGPVTLALWSLVLLAIILYAARRGQRGLFNIGTTFAAIFALAHILERFDNQPLAYVIAGTAAILLAWGIWRLNARWFPPKPTPET